ncbi:hypothetical protein HY029_00310 [Candidatus Gottesmanbacteria bacterium]|nr:hypothetical protein [Candidatus Gottesmanbacteria bacterium]
MKKKLQFLWLLFITFVKRHKKYLALGSLTGFFATLFFLQAYPIYNRISGVKIKKIAIVGRFSENTLPFSIQNQISLGLTSVLPSGEGAPAIAQKWEVDPSEKTYTFSINPNLFWHDGKRFTSRDINYKIKGAKIETPNDTIYKITLEEPYAPLPTILSLPIVKPNLIGTGGYKLSKIFYSGDFISELSLTSQIPDLPPLIYRFYPTADDAILAFKLGEVDILQNISDASDLATWKRTKITETNIYDNFIGIFFNLKDPLFKEKEVRQALTYAIPNFEKYTKAFTPVSPLSWAYSQKVRLYRYDPETASKILAKSEMASSSSEITITTFAAFIKLAQSIVDAWSKVGVHAKIKVVNFLPADYQILLLAQAIPSDPDQYQLWQSTQTNTNLTHYNNLKIDKLLEDGRKTIDIEKRKKIYSDFQRYLVDDAPVIFLYYPKVYTIERK